MSAIAHVVGENMCSLIQLSPFPALTPSFPANKVVYVSACVSLL